MHAIRLHEFGPAGNLRYEEVPDPEPGPGQVRIAVGAAGVHLIDTAIRSGRQMGPMPLPELPDIPGREVAGVVDAVGEGVDGVARPPRGRAPGPGEPRLRGARGARGRAPARAARRDAGRGRGGD